MNFYNNFKPEGTPSSHLEKSWNFLSSALTHLGSGISYSYNALCKVPPLAKKAYDNISLESEIFAAVSIAAGALTFVPATSLVAAAILSSPLAVAGLIVLACNSKEAYELVEETYVASSMYFEGTKDLTYAGSEITQAGILYAEETAQKAADFASELSGQVSKNWESYTHDCFTS